MNEPPGAPPAPAAEPLRLAELLSALSLATDLGMGHPPEEAIRTCLLATGLARRTGVPEEEVEAVYWTALLMHVGCTAFAHEQAALFGGDEIRVNEVGSRTDFGDFGDSLSFLFEVSRGLSPTRRARVVLSALAQGDRFGRRLATATCEVASDMARRLGLPLSVRLGLREMFERWDGRGAPRRLAGEAIALPARMAQLAAQATVFARIGGAEAAVAMAKRRSGGSLDPRLAEAFARLGTELLREIESEDPARAALTCEPEPHRWIEPSALDGIARAFADVVDLKTPFTTGHSSATAELARAAGGVLRLPEAEVQGLFRAGLLHDLGRLAVPGGIWEKPGILTTSEWETVRLHAYHTERILSRSEALAPLAVTAGMHHERLDGSGYHRGSQGNAVPMPARILAAADAYQAMTQARPHRPALPPEEAAWKLSSDAGVRRLDPEAVAAVLATAGGAFPRKRTRRGPRGLTDREMEVLRLLARGLTNKEMGRRLSVSPKTVGRHVEHIYQKLDVSSRAAATLFAAEHRLLE